MNNEQFIQFAKKLIKDYFNSRSDKTDNVLIADDDIFVVWSCKTLQNNKALLSTTVPDGMYYEITYNGDRRECHLDAYKKWENRCYKVED
nr:MAG TPA: hypothetical protein [Caudoviricetes sp.]